MASGFGKDFQPGLSRVNSPLLRASASTDIATALSDAGLVVAVFAYRPAFT